MGRHDGHFAQHDVEPFGKLPFLTKGKPAPIVMLWTSAFPRVPHVIGNQCFTYTWGGNDRVVIRALRMKVRLFPVMGFWQRHQGVSGVHYETPSNCIKPTAAPLRDLLALTAVLRSVIVELRENHAGSRLFNRSDVLSEAKPYQFGVKRHESVARTPFQTCGTHSVFGLRHVFLNDKKGDAVLIGDVSTFQPASLFA